MTRRRTPLSASHVTLAHGGGGRAMKDFVDDVFVAAFANDAAPLEDAARFDLASLTVRGDRLAFTTDAFVVDPLVFPGGDIGKLAVCGTINDLAVGGATPLYLSCAAILEEGTPIALVRQIARSMADTAARSGVRIVTGDTKVVPRGACDKVFLTTSGIGVVRAGVDISVTNARPDDVILVSGPIGDHGAVIFAARGDMGLDCPIESDCAPVHDLVRALLEAAPSTRLMRDPTRGGVATVLNEIAEASNVGLEIDDAAIPVRREVRSFCEVLGLEPLYLANEGKIVAVVPAELAEAALKAMRAHPLGEGAARIGVVRATHPGRVTLRTLTGGTRIVDVPTTDPLPRIC